MLKIVYKLFENEMKTLDLFFWHNLLMPPSKGHLLHLHLRRRRRRRYRHEETLMEFKFNNPILYNNSENHFWKPFEVNKTIGSFCVFESRYALTRLVGFSVTRKKRQMSIKVAQKWVH